HPGDRGTAGLQPAVGRPQAPADPQGLGRGGGPTMNDDRPDDPETLTLRQADRVDRVCDRFEAAWRAGERPSIADYLGAATGPERPALLRELIAADLEWRRRRGGAPDPEHDRRRFPAPAA